MTKIDKLKFYLSWVIYKIINILLSIQIKLIPKE